jgi:sec-independent protein translocase protein TatA
MGGLSWWHWLVIGGAFILLFGAKKLPDMARGVGRSLRILKSEVSAMSEDQASTPVPQTGPTVARTGTQAVGSTPTNNSTAPQYS